MSGFNLPPGCNVSDIPGNRPEDIEAEAIEEAFYKTLPEGKGFESITETDKGSELVWKAIEFGIKVGMEKEKQAVEENKYYEELAKEHEESKQ